MINQQHQCLCETCDKPSEYLVHPHDCPFNGYDYTRSQREAAVRISGCLSHPQAREYLMADVIKELEDFAHMLENQEPERGSENWCTMQAYRRAVALIKGGERR